MKKFRKDDKIYHHRMYRNDKLLKIEDIQSIIEDDKKKQSAYERRYKELTRSLLEANIQCEELMSKIEELLSQIETPAEVSAVQKNLNTRRALRCYEDIKHRISAKEEVKCLEDKRIIMKSLKCSLFLEKGSDNLLEKLADRMGLAQFTAGQCIIKEGDIGQVFYILKTGRCVVSKEDPTWKPLFLEPGTIFGDLAIIYCIPRVASVTAVDDVTLWFLSQKKYKRCVQSHDEECMREKLGFLKKLPFLEKLSDEKFNKLARCMKETTYERSHKIINEGEDGNTLYIIKEGKVNVMKFDGRITNFVVSLVEGEYFGEQALFRHGIRTASVVVDSLKCVCYEILIDILVYILGNIEDIKTCSERIQIERTESSEYKENVRYDLEKIKKVKLLGKGGFGKVHLVTYMDEDIFALKKVKKRKYVLKQDRKGLFNERDVLFSLNHAFIVKLYHTFRDSIYLYFLMQPLLGGELANILRSSKKFNNKTASFFCGCMVLAFEYLSEKNILHRDLKPENIMIDSKGYAILVDFGLAISLPPGGKTYTVCGTPIYMSPEMISYQGYDNARELWSIGILIYELLFGIPPYPNCDSIMEFLPYVRKGVENFKFPLLMNKHASDIIKKLCTFNPYERLGNGFNGFKDIKKHPWFSSIDWYTLEKREYTLSSTYKQRATTLLTSDSDSTSDIEDLSDWDLAF